MTFPDYGKKDTFVPESPWLSQPWLPFESPGFGDDSEPNRSFLNRLGEGELIFLYCYLFI